MTDRSRGSKRLATKHQPGPVYRLKVTLLEPPVWRRILVPGSITLDRLHTVLQEAMGWEDAHLHEFEISGRRYGEPDPDEPDANLEPERKVTLNKVAPEAGGRLEYLYDFGDGWTHEVLVESIEVPRGRGASRSAWLASARARPRTAAGLMVTPTSWRRSAIRPTPSMSRCSRGSAAPSIPKPSISTPSTES